MVTLSTIAQAQPQTKPETNGNEMAQLLLAFKLQQAQIEALTSQLAEAKTAPASKGTGIKALTKADFERTAKEIVIGGEHFSKEIRVKPEVNQNGTWTWSFESGTNTATVKERVQVLINGVACEAVIKVHIYISGSKDRP